MQNLIYHPYTVQFFSIDRTYVRSLTLSKYFIGGHKSKNFEMLPHDLPLHTGFSGCIFDIELRTKDTVFPVTSSSPATGRGVGECHRNECIRHSCKNGAVCLNHGSTYRYLLSSVKVIALIFHLP